MSEPHAIPVSVRPAVFVDIDEVAEYARKRWELDAVISAERSEDSPMRARIRAAEQKGRRIVSDAAAEARRLLDEAGAAADAARDAAREEGYRAGFQEGYAAGAAVAATEAVQAQAQARSDLDALVAQIEEERHAIWNDTEQQIVSFALEIAQKVVKDDAQVNRDIAISVIRNALRRVVDRGRIRIRVSVADVTHVRSSREALIGLVDGLDNVEIVEDRRVSPGGCVVETDSGTIDERFETQFAELSDGLDELRAEAA